MASQVRNIAPFINDEFIVTSPWWSTRINPITGRVEIHRGLDIATYGVSKPVYSMLNGIIHSKGYDNSQGNWVVIYDNNPSSQFYGYASRYMHLAQPVSLAQGSPINAGQQVGIEGTTGDSTGIHLHVEMQDLNRWGGSWHWSYVQSDYIDPTQFMGIDNVYQSTWIYDGSPYNPPVVKEKHKFPWVLYAKKLRNKAHFR